MSIQSEINRITGKRDQSFTELSNKGVTIQSGSTIDDLPGYIAALPETIKGAGVPTTSTAGLVGQHYFNTSATESPYEYVCTDATGGVYTWEPFAEKGETGDSGVYYGTTTPTDPDVNVWINPSGTGINIPTVTSTDNGKVMRVVNGAWAASETSVNNKTVKVVAGVARYSNGEWGLLNDTGHNPLNAVISAGQTDPGTFNVSHSVGASKVLSLVCGPDEGYAAQGVTCGASVGLDYSVVNVRWPKMAASAIAYNGSAYTHAGVASISSEDIVSTISMGSHATLGNYLKINLTKAYPGLFSVFSANRYDWKVLGYGLDYINIQPYLNGTRQSLPLASGDVSLTIAKQTMGVPSTIDHTGCNIWFLGIFEI